MCSQVVGLLKQLIHYVMMSMKVVLGDLTCTQMQQTWHRPQCSQTEAELVIECCILHSQSNPEEFQVGSNPFYAIWGKGSGSAGIQCWAATQFESGIVYMSGSFCFCSDFESLPPKEKEPLILDLCQRDPFSPINFQVMRSQNHAVPELSMHQGCPHCPYTTAINATLNIPSDIMETMCKSGETEVNLWRRLINWNRVHNSSHHRWIGRQVIGIGAGPALAGPLFNLMIFIIIAFYYINTVPCVCLFVFSPAKSQERNCISPFATKSKRKWIISRCV